MTFSKRYRATLSGESRRWPLSVQVKPYSFSRPKIRRFIAQSPQVQGSTLGGLGGPFEAPQTDHRAVPISWERASGGIRRNFLRSFVRSRTATSRSLSLSDLFS